MSNEAKREIDDFLKIFGTSLRHYTMPGTVDKAIAAWNRRAPSPDYPDNVEELVRAARDVELHDRLVRDEGVNTKVKRAAEFRLRKALVPFAGMDI